MAWFDLIGRALAARPVQRQGAVEGLTAAAVLVPLFVADGNLWLLLTRRSDSLPHHAGQVSFPGGAREAGDADDVATALRETHEELGIAPASVVVLGRLNDVRTPTGFVISPVVGALARGWPLRPKRDEVESVVPVPFTTLADPALVEEQELVIGAVRVRSPIFHYRGHRVWGATARIIADLVDRLGPEGLVPDERRPT